MEVVMRRAAVLLIVLMLACKEKPQPAETNTLGNATDRSPLTGTTGTGEPRNIATESAATATALATTPITGTNAVSVTGVQVVHGTKSETTGTLYTPTTTTASIATPTATSATVQTTTGARYEQKKKKP
jgi:hypothetical protein